jgi:hypothetical protein
LFGCLFLDPQRPRCPAGSNGSSPLVMSRDSTACRTVRSRCGKTSSQALPRSSR